MPMGRRNIGGKYKMLPAVTLSRRRLGAANQPLFMKLGHEPSNIGKRLLGAYPVVHAHPIRKFFRRPPLLEH